MEFRIRGPTQHRSISDQSGLVAVLILPMLVLLITCGIFQLGWHSWSQKEGDAERRCQDELIKLQIKNAKDIDRIFALNPKAVSLRVLKKRAEVSLALAITNKNPILIAQALKELEKIKGQQIKLDFRQKTILEENQIRTQQKVELIFSRNWTKKSKNINELVQIDLKNLRVIPVRKLAIEPDQPSEVAPVYRLKANFQSEQALQIEWQFILNTTNLKGLWNQKQALKKQICAVSLDHRKGKFHLTIWDRSPLKL